MARSEGVHVTSDDALPAWPTRFLSKLGDDIVSTVEEAEPFDSIFSKGGYET